MRRSAGAILTEDWVRYQWPVEHVQYDGSHEGRSLLELETERASFELDELRVHSVDAYLATKECTPPSLTRQTVSINAFLVQPEYMALMKFSTAVEARRLSIGKQTDQNEGHFSTWYLQYLNGK